MKGTMLASALFAAFFLFGGAHAATFTIHNKCPYTVWPATLQNSDSTPLPNTGFELPSNAAPVSINAPDNWAGRIWARTQCSTDASGKFHCLTSDCGSGQVTCNGNAGAPPTTIVEIKLKDQDGKDTYDISLVDGFNVPASAAPVGGSGCPTIACAANINAGCPAQLAVKGGDGQTAGCLSACNVFNTDELCCRNAFSSPEACKPSTYSMMFKSQCPQAYSYAHDDQSSTFTCTGTTGYDITFCP